MWKPRRMKAWEGSPGWNACNSHTRSEGGKSQAIREWITERLFPRYEVLDILQKCGHSDELDRMVLPRVPMRTIARWAVEEQGEATLDATACVIPEPFKARIITKGDARSYYAAMPLQKDSWRHLAEREEFALIASPQYLLSRGIQPADDLWIHPADDLWKIATLLGAHRISYSTAGLDPEEKVPEDFVMKNGQLMGSPLSFPILCARSQQIVNNEVRLEELSPFPIQVQCAALRSLKRSMPRRTRGRILQAGS